MIDDELINSVKIVVLTFLLLVEVNIGPRVDCSDKIFWMKITYINHCQHIMKQDAHIEWVIISLLSRLERLIEFVEVLTIAESLVVGLEVNDTSVAFLLSDKIWIISRHTEVAPR